MNEPEIRESIIIKAFNLSISNPEDLKSCDSTYPSKISILSLDTIIIELPGK